MARSGRHPGQGLEHDATHEDHEGGGHAEDGEECEEDLAVAGRGKLCVQLIEAEADLHDPADLVVIAVAALAFLEVPQGLKDRQHAAAVEPLFGLLRGDGLHRAGEQRVADPRAGLPAHLQMRSMRPASRPAKRFTASTVSRSLNASTPFRR